METKNNYSNNNFSLHNIDYFKKNISCNTHEILEKYSKLMNEYIKFIFENIVNKNKQYTKFIVIRGLDTITHVFHHILYYTKNLDITYFHSQKAFYFYVEFVGQITNEHNSFLQLSSRDAVMYVYKKTIFEVNNEYRKKIDIPSKEENEFLFLLNEYIKIYKILFLKLINDEQFLLCTDKNEYLIELSDINEKINYSNMNNDKINIFLSFINILNTKINNYKIYYDCVLLFIKNINKKKICKDNFFSDEFNIYLNDSSCKKDIFKIINSIFVS